MIAQQTIQESYHLPFSERGLNPDPRFSIERSLLFPVGEMATHVANYALAFSQMWLGIEQLPASLAHVEFSEPAQTNEIAQTDVRCRAIVAGCNRLAEARLIQYLHQQGYAVKQRNEIRLWVVIDLDPSCAKQSMTPDQLAALIEECIQQVRATLKVQLTPYALLLCEPQYQEIAAQWATSLHSACEERIYLCGSVNQQHLRIERWVEQVGETLAGLLWSERSAPSNTNWEHGSACWVTAVGASGWRSPNNELQQWLACRWIEAQVATVEQASGKPLVVDWLRSMEAMEREVAANVAPIPQPQAPVRWPTWDQLASLAVRTRNALHSLFERRAQAQREARMKWLEAQIARCEGIFTTHLQLRAGAESPSLADMRQWLIQVKEKLLRVVEALDQRLETLATEIQIQKERSSEAYALVESVCTQFPQATLLGALAALGTPWRWWRWLGLYYFELPERTQHLLHAEIGKATLAWQQENGLAIRQFLLILGQTIQQHEGQLAQIQSHLDQVKMKVLEQGQSLPNDCYLPWTMPRLYWLANRLAMTVEGWQSQSLSLERVAQLDTEALFANLWQQAVTLTLPILAWSPTKLLEDALPDPSQRQRWLYQQWDNATPLWPGDELLPAEECVDWLLLPTGEEWESIHHLPTVMRSGYCHFNGLLLVREIAVKVESGVRSQESKL